MCTRCVHTTGHVYSYLCWRIHLLQRRGLQRCSIQLHMHCWLSRKLLSVPFLWVCMWTASATWSCMTYAQCRYTDVLYWPDVECNRNLEVTFCYLCAGEGRCMNGGYCDGFGTCYCSPGYTGNYCENGKINVWCVQVCGWWFVVGLLTAST